MSAPNERGLNDGAARETFVFGLSGSIGGRLADKLLAQSMPVRGLVRTANQGYAWAEKTTNVVIDDLGTMKVSEIARMLRGSDTIVYAAGSNGGARAVTDSIDLEGVAKVVAAADVARVRRLILVSVMPEAWRNRDLDDDGEYYFEAKKRAEVIVSRSDLDWVILRPSLLRDEAGTGRISLGPAQTHGRISREDVVDTLVELVLDVRVSRQILELNAGSTPIETAVQQNVKPHVPANHETGGPEGL